MRAQGDEPRPGEGIEQVVGGRVRHYRSAAGMTAAELAQRSGVSAPMVSRIESASTSASLTTIARLAEALGVPVASLFRGVEARRAAVVVKAGQGVREVRDGSRHGHEFSRLGSILSVSGPSLEPVIVSLNADADDFPMFVHPGVEFLLVLSGSMRFAHGDDEYVLDAGDSILLDAEAAHGPVEVLEGDVSYLTVNTIGS
ncbi:helix-turn-helix domain-containing protein [Microbacterium indicum]|uniref:helix-turn-helix domain-containing protein n=1 Tax=Microbacterium indicum TaxID=358100 RepID=UPI0003FF12FE|nr:XRE family transcriptional regulator [Microbacterium indicum]